jgi:two-component system sensor histidine kinase UhpB
MQSEELGLDDLKAVLLNQRWPPFIWIIGVFLLLLVFTYFGFYHWYIKGGLLFAVFWIRPNAEFLGWYAINTLCSVVVSYINLTLRGLDSKPFLGLWPSAELFLIGTMMLPLLLFAAVQLLKARKISTANANTFRGMSFLLGTGLLAALLLTLKDIAFVLTDGKVSEVNAGKIIATVQLEGSNWFETLGSFIISHFMGAFIGIMIVVPLAMWIGQPAFRERSRRLLVNSLRYLLPTAVLISLALIRSGDSQFFGLLQVLLLAAVVVFTFFHGWRGAVVSVVLISVLIALDNHYDPYSRDPKQLQLYVSIVGALALLFGAAMDELKAREGELIQRQSELFETSRQKEELLNQLITASRRSMQAQDAERQRIAHELHDEVGQSVTALQIHLNLLQIELHQQGKGVLANRLTDISTKISDGVRSVVMDLAPIELHELGLYMAVAHGSFAKIARQAGLEYDVSLKGTIDDLERLDDTTRLAAYRIIQESITNVIKHAHATRCKVTISVKQFTHELLLIVDVRDDGVGLKDASNLESKLVSIRDRVLAFNGRLYIRSRNGFRVHALLRQALHVT